MKFEKKYWLIIGGIIVLLIGFFIFKSTTKSADEMITKEIKPILQDLKSTVVTIGTVTPLNRIEIKPSIPGRIEKVLVVEGQRVKKGQTLALMSSSERAALLDAALAKGKQVYDEWQNIYQAIGILAPIDGEIIVRNIEPGQTVSVSDAVLVESDRLIVKAQVDETDIGKVKVGQKVDLSLDSYPDEKTSGYVSQISYESVLINNVTIYYVEIALVRIPRFFRSGMSANVEIYVAEKKNALLIPASAVKNANGQDYVEVKNNGNALKKVFITTGIKSDSKIEVVSGLTLNDTIIVREKKYSLNNQKKAGNMLINRPQRSQR